MESRTTGKQLFSIKPEGQLEKQQVAYADYFNYF